MAWAKPADKKSKDLILAQVRDYKKGRLVEPFSDTNAWLKAYGGGTVSFINGMLQVTSTGTSIAARRNILLNLTGAKTLKIKFYVDNLTDFYEFQIYLAHDTGYAEFLGYTVRGWRMALGWNEHIIDVSKLEPIGAASLTRDIVSMQIRVKSNDNTTASIIFDSIIRDETQRGKVIFMFDDGWLTQYTEAFKYMGKFNLPGVIAVIPSHVGWSGYCTLQQLKEMYAYGWDMANHTMNHATLKDLKDTAAIEKEIGEAETWLNTNGFTRASNILAYPYGAYDARVLQVMQSRRAGRTVQEDTVTTPPPDKRTIKIRNVDHTITPATLKGHIDNAAKVGGVCLFMFHKIVSGEASSSIEYNVSNFQEVVDYAYSRRADIDTVTMSEWLDSCGL
ncbi:MULTISPECIES: polysaccharide deacetylase family protein [Brevibacillus]|uniref:polysaccharide deacetylase family protein n=1 Tax=Brevibacillus TaxID=55080 RepID=UPI000D10D1E8|nr:MULTISPECIES: polysaccharide deacetylase family protein [Brevibacillus]MED1947083.1 polysaccharide deacetylase family protein [Brevibacillus formosus]MED2000441.1 polysaccharide deacetylase family protein [Brevibacillus formosus]MED2085770.1 polysaccharide deacetylase family protein [Brevibacillus formosus]PSK13470.1 hypothetical protein C7R94_22565 [Brevibacillus sp. NRRL NRS-603]